MAASPICEVKDGAAAYVATTSGVDVTVGNTIVIRLASTVDVSTWLIECATTDDTSSASAATAALSIDSTLRTATFTAPAAGKAYRFRSRVNNGLDVNGIADASLETTFCIYTLTTGSRRVVAADETTEGDATFGWIKWLNDLIRNPTAGSGTSPGGSTTQFQYNNGGTFAGASGMRYTASTFTVDVSSLVVTKDTVLGGTTVHTGVAIAALGNARHRTYSEIKSLKTSNSAAGQPIYAWNLLDEAVTAVFVSVNAVPSGGAAGGSYGRRARFWANGGIATMGSLEASWDDEVTASGVGFTGLSVGSGIVIGHSGMTGFVRVKGSATGAFDFGATITREETSWS